MTAQVTWDTFIPRAPMGKRTVHLKYDEDAPYEYCTVRQDAEVIVRDIGKYPAGGSTCDRLMDMGKPHKSDLCLMDPDTRELHYWSHNTRGYYKEILYDGTVTDYFIHHANKGHGEYIEITDARIEGDELVFVTEKADYCIPIIAGGNGSMVNYIDSKPYDPAYYTEHLMIHALNHGKTPQDIKRFMSLGHCVCLDLYDPFTRDHRTGELVPSPSFNMIADFANEVGIRPKFSQDVQPYRPNIYPVAEWKYCYQRLKKICDKKKDQCICCHRFFSRPEIEIDPKDLAIDRPKKLPKKYAMEVGA